MKLEACRKLEDFRHIVKAVYACTEEATFRFRNEGLLIKELDREQIAMIQVRDSTANYSKYLLEQPEVEASFNLNTKKVLEVLKRFENKKADLCLFYDEQNLKLCADDQNVSLKANPQTDSEIMPLNKEPACRFDTSFVIDASKLKASLQKLKDGSPHIAFCVQGVRGIVLKAVGETEQELILPPQDFLAYSYPPTPFSVVFSLDYLLKFIYSFRKGDILTVLLGSKTEEGRHQPLKISGKIAGAEVVYWLAPRIEDVF